MRPVPAPPAAPPAPRLPDLTSLADRYPDERDLLRALSVVLGEGEDWLAEARRMRVYAALRLRQKGQTMRAIAEDAGVTDSYLAREVFKMGATRRRRARIEGDDD